MVICVFNAKGHKLIFDKEGYRLYLRGGWYVDSCGYLRKSLYKAKPCALRFHRVFICAPPHRLVDHINGNPLDNRLCNLRLATSSQSNRNRLTARPSKGAYKHRRRWQAAIGIAGKRYYLGVFSSEAEAHEAYCKAARAADPEFFCDGKRR